MTAAERQQRRREKLRSQGDPAVRIAELEAEVERLKCGHATELRAMMEDGEDPLDFLRRACDPDGYPRVEIGPMLAEMLGLSRDLWPGLTHGDMRKLFRSQNRAKQYDVRVDTGYPGKEATFREKLIALHFKACQLDQGD